MEFKEWLDHEDEYAAPDEKEMQLKIKTPLKCSTKPDLRGDRFIFHMPLGNYKDYLIKFSGIVGLNSAPGSLNAKCYDLFNKGKFIELYKLMQYLQFNNNSIIRKQLLAFSER